MKKMKNQKGVTLVALVVTIIVLIILAGISINLVLGDNGIITIAKRAKENVELAKIEEETELNELYIQLEINGSDSSSSGTTYDAIAKITEFKTAIANAIEEAGGIKPEVSSETAIFANNIKGIVKEVTKDATATESDIAEGKTAWVNGNKITGTMEIKTTTIKNYGSVSSGNISADFPNYKDMTSSNFFLVCTGASATPGRVGGNTYGLDSSSIKPKINYNSTDGSFTVSNTSIKKSGSSVELYTASLSISYNVICVY